MTEGWAQRPTGWEEILPEREHFNAIRDVIAHLGVADVRAFGLTWEDCERLLKQLGYAADVNIVAT